MKMDLMQYFHEKETHKGLQLTLFTLGTILFLWGAMIRKDAGFLILIVGIPFLFHSIYLSQKKIISSGKIISVVFSNFFKFSLGLVTFIEKSFWGLSLITVTFLFFADLFCWKKESSLDLFIFF